MSRVVAIILAAGNGKRLGGPKALLAWPSGKAEKPLAIAHAEERLSAESNRVLVVTRGPLLKALIKHVQPGIDLLASDAADELGPAGSLAYAAPRLGDAEIAVVTPVDNPPARADSVARLLDRLIADPSLLAARPSYHGRAGHPVVMRVSALEPYKHPAPPTLRDHLRSLGDRCVDTELGDPAVLVDLNTPADVMGTLGALPRFLT